LSVFQFDGQDCPQSLVNYWRVIYAANTETEAARNGIGLVKLMGRDSGFIAAFSVLVDSQANFCLVPEVPFTLKRFLAELKRRLELRSHAVIVVAEVAGQDLMEKTAACDASGNVKYGDIGMHLEKFLSPTRFSVSELWPNPAERIPRDFPSCL
jgi:6-phosphofructokinase 1